MINTAVILAGGFGTRLQSVIKEIPKPMAPVAEKPFLEFQLRYLKHYGIKNIVFSTGHLSEKIREYFGSEFQGLKISYSHEESPLGTGGGIRQAMENISDEEVLVLNGDSFFDIDLANFHELHSSFSSECSIALRKVKNASRYGTIEIDSNDRICSFREKSGLELEGLINGGVYIINRDLFLKTTPSGINFSIEKDFFEKQLERLIIKGFEFDGYFIDIGIPEDYNKAQNDFKEFKY